jgi:hypothetical protein
MANKIATISGTVNWHTLSIWDGSTLPSPGDNLNYTGSGTIVLEQNDTNVYGTETCDAGVAIDYGVYEFHAGLFTNNGNNKEGDSAGLGVFHSGIIFNAGSNRDWQNASKVTNSGDYWFLTGATLTTARARGTYVQTAPGVFRTGVINCTFYSIIQNSGAHITNYQGLESRTGDADTARAEFNANLDTTGSTSYYGFVIRCGPTGTMIFGPGFNIIGGSSKVIKTYLETSQTITNNMTTAPSFTGYFLMSSGTTSTLGTFPSGDWRNSGLALGEPGGASRNRYLNSGTLKIGYIRASTNSFSYNLIMRLDVTNTNIEVYGTDFTLAVTLGVGIIIWNKGTGYIKYLGSTDGNIDYAGNSMEEQVFENTGIKSIVSDYTATKVSGTGLGLIVSSVAGTIRTISVSSFSAFTGLLFRDVVVKNSTTGVNYQMLKTINESLQTTIKKQGA